MARTVMAVMEKPTTPTVFPTSLTPIGSVQIMVTGHTEADKEIALRIAKTIVPEGFVVDSLLLSGRLWVRIDHAPFPALLPSSIIRFGRILSYSVGSDARTYPPTVSAVVQSIRTALLIAGIEGVDISLSYAAATRQAAEILALSLSAHGRMRLASLLGAAGLDDEAIAKQLEWLGRTS